MNVKLMNIKAGMDVRINFKYVKSKSMGLKTSMCVKININIGNDSGFANYSYRFDLNLL